MSDKRVDPNETAGNMEDRFHPPGDFNISNVSTVGAQATATGAAGVGGQKKVVTGFQFRIGANVQLGAATIGCYVIDGASGGGTYLYREVIAITTTGAALHLTGLSILGTANTAVTIEFSAGLAGATESVNLQYHHLAGAGA